MENEHNLPVEHFDPSFSLNEQAEIQPDDPDCRACGDEGMIEGEVYCDCDFGDLALEVHLEMEAEVRAERMATDYGYAMDSQGGDDPEPGW